MTFRRLAYNNVKGNWHQYSAFFLSSAFTVMIFYIYAAFIFHPDVVSGHISAAAKVRQGMVACEYVIIVFSFFFVLYSVSAFLKSRKKEFGLLTLYGMTAGQLRKLVVYENMFISLMSIGAGIGLGILFSKLFFMALAELLRVDNPIRFLIAPKALYVTAGGFFALFMAITAFSLARIGRSEIIELLAASRKPKSLPLFSWMLVLVAIVCLAGGYTLAYRMTPQQAIVLILPIVGLVMIGTYFLFTQASVALLRRMQRRSGFYMRGTNIVTVSQLVFKMKDNARVLFMVSVLSAVVLTASGTFYVFREGTKEQTTSYFPQSIGYVERGLDRHTVLDPEQVNRVLSEENAKLDYEVRMAGVAVPVKLFGRSAEALLVSEDEYNKLTQRIKGRQPAQVEYGHAVFVYPYRENKTVFYAAGDTLETTVGGQPLALRMDGQTNGAVVPPVEEATYLLVADSRQYDELMKVAPDADKAAAYGFELVHWESGERAAERISQLVPADERFRYQSRIASYVETRQLGSLTLFIGIFISVLFFIASGSMIYFKLFTELQEDQAQFRALTRIGMTLGEIRRIVSTQVGMIFFVPCLVGTVHAAFAMKSLGNLMAVPIWRYALLVVLIFAAMQTFYFLLARRSYLKRILRETVH